MLNTEVYVSRCGGDEFLLKIVDKYVQGNSSRAIANELGIKPKYVRDMVESVYLKLNEEEQEVFSDCHERNKEFLSILSIKNVNKVDAKQLYDVIAPKVIDQVINCCEDDFENSFVNTYHIADTIWYQLDDENVFVEEEKKIYSIRCVREMTRKILQNLGFTLQWSVSNRHVLLWSGYINTCMICEFPTLKKFING